MYFYNKFNLNLILVISYYLYYFLLFIKDFSKACVLDVNISMAFITVVVPVVGPVDVAIAVDSTLSVAL